jgi:hypothetical protein
MEETPDELIRSFSRVVLIPRKDHSANRQRLTHLNQCDSGCMLSLGIAENRRMLGSGSPREHALGRYRLLVISLSNSFDVSRNRWASRTASER